MNLSFSEIHGGKSEIADGQTDLNNRIMNDSGYNN